MSEETDKKYLELLRRRVYANSNSMSIAIQTIELLRLEILELQRKCRKLNQLYTHFVEMGGFDYDRYRKDIQEKGIKGKDKPDSKPGERE